MSYFEDPKRYLTSLAHISAPCLSVLQLPSLDTPVNSFSGDNILIAIIYNCAIPLQSSASASRNLHNQGVENAIQHYFWASLIPHCTFNTLLPVKVRYLPVKVWYFFFSRANTNISQADYILVRHTNGCFHSMTSPSTPSVDTIHPVVTPSQAPMPSKPLVCNVVNSSSNNTLALAKSLRTGVLTNVLCDMVAFTLLRHWINLSFQGQVFSKLLDLLIKINPDPDFDRDNPTHLVSSFILAALPSFQLRKCILMFLVMFATFSIHATEQVIHYLCHIAILQDRSNLSPIKDRGVCYGTIFSLNISIYIPILLVPINDILKTDSVLKPNSVLNILKTNSVPTNILYINLPRTQKMSS